VLECDRINESNYKKEGSVNMNRIAVYLVAASLAVGWFNLALAGNITGKVKARGVKNSGDAVIYIEKVPGKKFDPPKEHAKMDQKNLTFMPHVLPILAGTTVDYLNSDDVLHNVFSPDKCAEKLNLGTWPKGQTKSYTFKEPGCVAVMLCNVHPEMEAYIVVLETPYYAVSAKDGSYTVKNVPAGKYTLKIWHQKLKAEPKEITIAESGEVAADFELKK
jgi:plastocyanin